MIRRPVFRRLERSGPGRLTVTHVPTTGPVTMAREAAFEWGSAVWETYALERSMVYGWLREAGFGV